MMPDRFALGQVRDTLTRSETVNRNRTRDGDDIGHGRHVQANKRTPNRFVSTDICALAQPFTGPFPGYGGILSGFVVQDPEIN